MKWIKKWQVKGTEKVWTVSLSDTDEYGCSCPVWKFRRQQCHHIEFVKSNPSLPTTEDVQQKKPEIVLVFSAQPHREGDRLVIPLVTIGNTNQEATICDFLLHNGYSMGDVREARNIPRQWTARAIQAHIAQHGPAIWPTEPERPHA